MSIAVCALLVAAAMAGPVGCGNIQHLLHRRVNTTVEFGAESYCTIVSIEWMKDDEKVCDWSGGSVKCYGKYKYAAKVDVLTGDLKLSNLEVSHSGRYTVKLNNLVRFTPNYLLVVFEPVPKPTVLLTPPDCNSASPKCTLTCAVKDYNGEVEYAWPKVHGWAPGQKQNLSIDATTALPPRLW